MSDLPPFYPDEFDEIPPEVELPTGARNLEDARTESLQQKRVDSAETQAQIFWRDVLATPVGRAEIWRLFRWTNPEGNPFAPPFASAPNGFPHTQGTFFQAGGYAVGQQFLQFLLQQDMPGVHLMLEEHAPSGYNQPPVALPVTAKTAKRRRRSPP